MKKFVWIAILLVMLGACSLHNPHVTEVAMTVSITSHITIQWDGIGGPTREVAGPSYWELRTVAQTVLLTITSDDSICEITVLVDGETVADAFRTVTVEIYGKVTSQ